VEENESVRLGRGGNSPGGGNQVY